MKRLMTGLLPIVAVSMTALLIDSVASAQDRSRGRPQEVRSRESAPELTEEGNDVDLDEEMLDSEDFVDGEQVSSDDILSESEPEDLLAVDSETTRSAAASENMPVWRLQVRFQTADVSDAGTDDDVKVQLNTSNATWVNYGRDDFERGDDFTYDLIPIGVSKLSDITRLKVSKTGSDGWCLKRISLLVNGQLIYSKYFSANHWLDNSEGYINSYTISSSTLRASATWRNYTEPELSPLLRHQDVESLIEAAIGHFTHGEDLRFSEDRHGSGYVEVSRGGPAKIHVDLDLQYTLDYFCDPEVDVDFNVALSCSGGQLSVSVLNLDVGTDFGLCDDLSGDLVSEVVDELILDDLESAISQGLQHMPLPGEIADALGEIDCSRLLITVLSNGDVIFLPR